MKPLSIRSALAGAVLFALAVTACYETDPLPPAPSSDVYAPLPKQSRPRVRGVGPSWPYGKLSLRRQVEASVGDTLTIETTIDPGGTS